jgi:hypothetical protein
MFLSYCDISAIYIFNNVCFKSKSHHNMKTTGIFLALLFHNIWKDCMSHSKFSIVSGIKHHKRSNMILLVSGIKHHKHSNMILLVWCSLTLLAWYRHLNGVKLVLLAHYIPLFKRNDTVMQVFSTCEKNVNPRTL